MTKYSTEDVNTFCSGSWPRIYCWRS